MMTWFEVLSLCLLTVIQHVALQSTRPHIIFIVADDMGWHDTSFHGSEIKTPFIDSLAYKGIILNNYYVSPICSPTRTAILTGRHPIHTGMQHGVIIGASPYGLSLNETIMPQYLKELGYATHIVGKWHLGHYTENHTPTRRGFDSFFGFFLGHEDYYDHSAEDGWGGYWGYDFRRNQAIERGYGEVYSTELYTQEANAILRLHNTSQPLFLWLAHQAVHAGNYNGDPVQAPQKYVERFPDIEDVPRKTFAGMTSALDDSVASVFQTLEETGMLNNSIIIFTTDNGGPTNGYDRSAACNWPLRGCKNTMWEGGVRGNGFIYSPLLSTSGYVQENMMHITDWLPTLYHAAGGDVNKLRNQDGYNLWEMLSTKGPAVRYEIIHNIDPTANFSAIRVGEFKLIDGHISGGKYDSWYPPPEADAVDINRFLSGNPASDNIAVVGQPIEVKCGPKPLDAEFNCKPEVAPCLFHIPSDPCEFHNIAASHPAEVQALLDRIDEYRKTMVPPSNKPIDPRANPALHGGAWGPWLADEQGLISIPNIIGRHV
ncbi:arylsulfatase B-like [Haliotis asinina]|uniref:arylsulfatase B-like n=1 Tax=Haliotis asinina TaxID=109174 RepID=UPI003532800C